MENSQSTKRAIKKAFKYLNGLNHEEFEKELKKASASTASIGKLMSASYVYQRFPGMVKRSIEIDSLSYSISSLIGKKKFEKYYKNLLKEAYGQFSTNSKYILYKLRNKYQEELRFTILAMPVMIKRKEIF